MSSFVKPTDQPFAGGGGVSEPVGREEDPYQALDELMAVVEVLCPVWPQREVSLDLRQMLL